MTSRLLAQLAFVFLFDAEAVVDDDAEFNRLDRISRDLFTLAERQGFIGGTDAAFGEENSP